MFKKSFNLLRFPTLSAVFLSVSILLIGKHSFSQTTLISPTGDGGFETGTTLANNNWTVVNAATNTWQVGTAATAFAGSRGAYVSNNSGTTWAYSIGTPQTSHFYRDVTVPAGETNIQLSFYWKGSGESGFDRLLVYTAPTTVTPVAGTPASNSTTLTGATLVYTQASYSQTTYTQANVTLNSSLAGTTVRLIFTWQNDGSLGTSPGVAIDNISLISFPTTAMSGVYTIDNGSTESATNYKSIDNAVRNINARGISSSVTFNVIAGQTFNENLPALTATGTASNTITFQKSGVGNNPKIVPTGTATGASATDFGICISGGDYITFDGIDVDGSAATTTTNAIEFGYLIRNASATNGAQYNTIKNCSVTLNKNYISAAANACIFSSVSSTQGGVTPTNATGANSYNKYYNLTLSNAQNGIYAVGNTTYPDLSCQFGVAGSGCQTSRNSITNMGGVLASSSAYGVYAQYQSGAKIFNCDVSNIRSNVNTTAGILLINFAGTNEIYNNKVSDISNSGTSSTGRAVGIELQNSSGTPTTRVYNNFVFDIKSPFTGTATASIYAYGIYCNNTTTATISEIDNNNVYLSVASGTPTYSSVCFANASTFAVHKVRGNVFVNAFPAQGATAKHWCWYSTSATSIGAAGSVSNYNDLLITTDAATSGHVGRGSTTNYNTVANWNTATTQDANSISIDPTFTSSTDLHVSAAGLTGISGFSPQAWVTTDIDCDPQGPTYRIGADAPAGSACTIPADQATSLQLTSVTSSSLQGSFTAAASSPSGYLVVRSTSNTLSANPVNTTSYSAGNALGGGVVVQSSASTTFSESSLTDNTTYYYFIFSYNNSGCSGGPLYNVTTPLTGFTVTCLTTPSTPTFSGITSSEMTVNWGAITGATSYNLEVSTNSGFTAPISGSPFSVAGTSQTINGLTSGNTYYVRVTAVGPNCNSFVSGSANTMLLCATPISLAQSATSTAQTLTTISGTFTAASVPPTGYLVVRTIGNTVPSPTNNTTYSIGSNAIGYIEYVGANATTWTSTGLNINTTYYYWVFSYNSGTCTGPQYSTSSTSFIQSTLSCPTFQSTISINGAPSVSGVSYPTISDAIFALNTCGGISQPTILELTSGYVNELTNNTLTLPAISGMSNTNTITIRPSSGVSNLEISSSVSGPTIFIDGGDYWIIDGRPGGTGSLSGSNLAITNTGSSTSSMSIQIMNDALGNIIRYSNLKLSNGSGDYGVIAIRGGTTNITGNDNNSIEYNNIDGNGVATNGVFCFGSTNKNDNCIIQNNNIFDFFRASVATNGVQVGSNNDAFTISNNSIYQTVARTYTTGATHSGILINNTSGNNFSVNGNQVGGGFSVNGGPTPANKYTIAGSTTNRYKAINLAVGTTTATSVQSNTIAGFDFTSTSASTTNGGPWCGIYVSAGKVNIGSNFGNTIGSSTGNGSISLNLQTNSGGVSSGIYIEAIASDFNISNNSIGSITTTGSAVTNDHGFTGIATLATGTVTISNNLIGSRTTANSINASNAATTTGTYQYLNGISNTGNSSALTISYNTIANLNNAYVPSSFQSTINSIVCGISSTAGTATLIGDTVRNLTANANATNTGLKASIVGISVTSNAGATVAQNLVHSLNSTNTAGTTISVTGIAYSGATSGTNVIERNRIYNLNNTSATSGRVHGIFIVAGNANVQNNMIRLGYDVSGSSILTPISIYGFYEAAGTNNYYHNSVYVGGSNVTSNTTIPSTAALYSVATPGTTRNILNNILVNSRSNSSASGGPKNYAIYLPSSVLGLTCNYNIFQSTGTGSVFGSISGGDRADFTAWKASSSAPDANSINADPLFLDPTNATSPDLHINQNQNSPADKAGTNVAAVTTDFDNQTRSDYSAVDIGADAFIKTPTLLLSGTPSALTTCLGIASSTTSYTLNGYGLTGDVTVSGGDYLEVSTSGSGPFNSSVSVTPINGSITNQTIYTRIKINSLVGNGVSAQISHSSTGATSVSQSVSVTINQPSTTVSVSGVTINDGDYLWNGNTSSDGSNANNWFVLNNGNYELAINAPSSSDKVFIVPYSIESACISQTNSPNNPSVGSFSSKDFYIGSGASLTLGDNVTFNISGDFINNGTFNSGSGTVLMNGTSAQTIGGSSNTVFNNLTIDNSSGASLTNSISVNGTLNLSSGKLNLNEHTLTIGTNSSDGLITGASSINYIVAYKNGVNMGKLIRHINSNTSYSFPIGDLSKYTPLTFSLNSGDLTNATLQVYTIAEKVTGLNPDVSCYINRSWSVEPTGITNPNYNISYSFGIGDFTGDENISLSPIKLSNGIWYKPSNSSLSSGTVQGSENATIFSDNQVPAVETTGTLTWNSLTSFSEFGGAGGNQPLPVELISFNGNCSGEEIILNWNTASEHNSSYFDVEESRDGVSWNVLSSLPAAGNSTSLLNYSLTDKFITSSNNYYRLKQVDIDGTFKIHSPINVSCNEINSKLFLSYPNPSSNSFNVVINDDKMVGNSHLSVFDVTGKNVFQKLIEINNGINMFMIDEKLVPGIYFIKINNGIKSTETIRHIAN